MFYRGESGSILGSVVRIWFAHPGKGSYSSTCCCDELKSSKRKHAVVAQLVEHHLAKVDVASSSLVNRSLKPRGSPRGFFVVSGFYYLRVFAVSGRYGFWRRGAGGGCDLSRGGCLGGLAAGLLWLSGYLTAGLSDDLTARSSDCREAVQEKIFKKIWGSKRARERGKLLSESPRTCFEG